MKNTIKEGVILVSLCFAALGVTLVDADIPVQQSDAEILGILSVIDQNEIQAAQLAEQKDIERRVLDYARMLDSDHNKHLDKTRQLTQELGLTIQDSPFLDELRKKGEKDLAALTVLNGVDFAQLYIADMIKGHAEVLNWINSQDAQNQRLKNFLKETRQTVGMHLQTAQKIENKQQAGQS